MPQCVSLTGNILSEEYTFSGSFLFLGRTRKRERESTKKGNEARGWTVKKGEGESVVDNATVRGLEGGVLASEHMRQLMVSKRPFRTPSNYINAVEHSLTLCKHPSLHAYTHPPMSLVTRTQIRKVRMHRSLDGFLSSRFEKGGIISAQVLPHVNPCDFCAQAFVVLAVRKRCKLAALGDDGRCAPFFRVGILFICLLSMSALFPYPPLCSNGSETRYATSLIPRRRRLVGKRCLGFAVAFEMVQQPFHGRFSRSILGRFLVDTLWPTKAASVWMFIKSLEHTTTNGMHSGFRYRTRE